MISQSVVISNALNESLSYTVKHNAETLSGYKIVNSGTIPADEILVVDGIVIGDDIDIITPSNRGATITVNATGNSKFLARYNIVGKLDDFTTNERIIQRTNGETNIVVTRLDTTVPNKTGFTRNSMGFTKDNMHGYIKDMSDIPREIVNDVFGSQQGYTGATKTKKGELVFIFAAILIFVVILGIILFYMYSNRGTVGGADTSSSYSNSYSSDSIPSIRI
jgi:hypothetical protein